SSPFTVSFDPSAVPVSPGVTRSCESSAATGTGEHEAAFATSPLGWNDTGTEKEDALVERDAASRRL
ncbi:MAG: hypothetical protein M3N15_05180, partial [Actinomycetota bacterium]|nr:hypothetical protein [Actinomycetota bacterium]